MSDDKTLIADLRHHADILEDEAGRREARNALLAQMHRVRAIRLRRAADRLEALTAATPRPMKDAPRDGVTLVVSEMLAKDLRAWADRQEVLEPAHSARRRDLISILQQISSRFLPHPPEADVPRDRGKMVKPKPGDRCGGYATEGGDDD